MPVVIYTMTPKPETINAYLESAGYKTRKATLHFFIEARETTVDGPRGDAWEFIYKCSETGAERRWGIVERLDFTDTGEGN